MTHQLKLRESLTRVGVKPLPFIVTFHKQEMVSAKFVYYNLPFVPLSQVLEGNLMFTFEAIERADLDNAVIWELQHLREELTEGMKYIIDNGWDAYQERLTIERQRTAP